MRAKKSTKNTIFTILIIFFLAVFIFSAVMLVKDLIEYKKIDTYYDGLQTYRPSISPTTDPEVDTSVDDTNSLQNSQEDDPVVNQTIIDLMAQYPDVVGWLTVDGADISYPMAQGADNDQYLKSDLDGSYLSGGTLFMDYRCASDFSNDITIIYGHNMKNGSMFGLIDDNYGKSGYMDENPDVYVSLEYENIRYTAVAYLVVDSNNSVIYDLNTDPATFAEYITNNARFLNSTRSFSGEDSFLVFSTCVYEYEDARGLLICVREPE